MEVSIKNIHGVAAWVWDVGDDNCGICQASFDACCPDCKLPGDDCPPVSGRCRHVFHMHCILKWISGTTQGSQQQCPMCRQLWEFAGE